MNNVTPYEILIAEKTEQLPVPDMADSIWASIEEQLDAGLSPDDNDTTPDQTPPGKGLPGLGKGFYTFITVAAVVTAVFVFTENKKDTPSTNQQQQQPLPAPTEIIIPPKDTSQAITGPPLQNDITPVVTPTGKNDIATSIDTSNVNPVNADFMDQVVIPNINPDSAIVKKDNLVLPKVDSTAIITHPPPRKPKGVKGITSDDYKITSGNDSTKKKQ